MAAVPAKQVLTRTISRNNMNTELTPAPAAAAAAAIPGRRISVAPMMDWTE
jgi:hypothetical protein